MAMLLHWIVLAYLCVQSQQKCVLDLLDKSPYRILKCMDTNTEDYLYDIFHMTSMLYVDISKPIGAIEVTNSNFTQIYAFLNYGFKVLNPRSVEENHGWERFHHYPQDEIYYIDISNSLVKFISEDVFRIHKHLEVLKLADNHLTNISFVKSLPEYLKELHLRGNKLAAISNVFSHLVHLKLLDLSNCRIETIESRSFLSLSELDFLYLNNNKIEDLDLLLGENQLQILDASFNRIRAVDIFKECCYGDGLAISFNLSHNNLMSVKLEGSYVSVRNLDLSYATDLNVFEILNNFTVTKISELNINGNLPKIKIEPSSFTKFHRTYKMNMYMINASIKDIRRNAFANISDFENLSFSQNDLGVLRSFVFSGTKIFNLDASKCSLRKIEANAFFGANIKNLNLSQNYLKTLEAEAFKELEDLDRVDLSHNLLEYFSFDLFNNLNWLDLSHNRIIQLKGLLKLNFLSLAHNNISNLKHLNGKLLDLRLNNNNIEVLKNSTFVNITNLRKVDLSNSNIRHIENNAFCNLGLDSLNLSRNNNLAEIEEVLNATHIDLSGNNISKALSPSPFRYGNGLKTLRLSFNGVMNAKSFVTLNHLQSFIVIDSNIETINKLAFKGLINVELMEFSNTIVHNLKPGCFIGLSSLRTFTSIKEIFKKITDLESGIFEGLSILLHLDLSGLSISSIEVRAFKGLDSLTELNLKNNNLTHIPLGALQTLPRLNKLFLENNQLLKISAGTFSNLKKLNILNLAHNNLTKLAVEVLIPLESLNELYLDSNHLLEIEHYQLFLRSATKHFQRIGITDNKWKCKELIWMLDAFKNHSVVYEPEKPEYMSDNIDGVSCINLCKFVFCDESRE